MKRIKMVLNTDADDFVREAAKLSTLFAVWAENWLQHRDRTEASARNMLNYFKSHVDSSGRMRVNEDADPDLDNIIYACKAAVLAAIATNWNM